MKTNLIILILFLSALYSYSQNTYYYHFVIDSSMTFKTGDKIILPTCSTESENIDEQENNNFICEVNLIIELLEKHPTCKIEIGAHTDCKGDNDYSISQSQNKADKFQDFIITYGINPNRILAKGYGAKKPRIIDKLINKSYTFFAENLLLDCNIIEKLETTEKKELAHQLNKRIEIKILNE